VAGRRAGRRPLLLDGAWDREVRSGSQAEVSSAEPSQKNEQEQIDFQEGLPDRLDSAKAEASRPVRLFCQDECRFGLMPVKRHRITLPGVKPIQEAKPGYEYFYLYGAVSLRSS